jgi:hypothetical protein
MVSAFDVKRVGKDKKGIIGYLDIKVFNLYAIQQLYI